MGLAVNASTLGMAIAGLAVAFFSRRIDRRLGIAASLVVFSGLTLAGAFLVWFWLGRAAPAPMPAEARAPLSIWAEHLRNGALRASFAIGFLILFAFIGTFTYVNFVLVREPLSLSRMAVGFVYFVFLPSIVTTPLAGRPVERFGTQPTFWGALVIAGAGLPLRLLPQLVP